MSVISRLDIRREHGQREGRLSGRRSEKRPSDVTRCASNTTLESRARTGHHATAGLRARGSNRAAVVDDARRTLEKENAMHLQRQAVGCALALVAWGLGSVIGCSSPNGEDVGMAEIAITQVP